MADESRPIMFRWEAIDSERGAMVPLNGFWAKRADEQYYVGQEYRMAPHEDRSLKSHQHYFACLNEAWRNLPDDHAARWPSPEHLRKWCLIKAGYRTERSVVCTTPEEAERVAAFVRPMDGYAVVTVRDNVVVVYEAESQSMRAMRKERFQQSKDDVLNELAKIAGVSADELKQNAGMAA